MCFIACLSWLPCGEVKCVVMTPADPAQSFTESLELWVHQQPINDLRVGIVAHAAGGIRPFVPHGIDANESDLPGRGRPRAGVPGIEGSRRGEQRREWAIIT